MMSPEAHFFFLMTCGFVLNINFSVRGCTQHTWWIVCSWGLGRSWLVPRGLATAWNTTQCPKPAASCSRVILDMPKEGWELTEARDSCEFTWGVTWAHIWGDTEGEVQKGTLSGDTAGVLGKECSVTGQGCLWGDCGHGWPVPEQGHSWGAPIMGKLWMSRGAVRRKGVRRNEGQREAITSRLQPPAPSITSTKGWEGLSASTLKIRELGWVRVEERC